MKNSKLIVMLTLNDKTVENASEIFEACKASSADFWGIKESGLPKEGMKELFSKMKDCGKKTVLEIVAYNEKEGLKYAKLAKELDCDILMGTCYYDSVNDFCKENNLKYMPFVGKVSQRPSVLEGSVDDIIKEAKQELEKGVFGFDLLAYRYKGNAEELIDRFTKEINAPVCIAGSINNFEKLSVIKKAKPWGFTVGSAFFENSFKGTIEEQINKVSAYVNA